MPQVNLWGTIIVIGDMQRTGKYIRGRWVPPVELLPGEFEVLARPSRLNGRSGQFVLTNQRVIWRPNFRRKARESDLLLIAHERITSCAVTRPWQHFFLENAIRLRLNSGLSFSLYVKDAGMILPAIREHMTRSRYKPGDLFA
jgi:hypothetical protein